MSCNREALITPAGVDQPVKSRLIDSSREALPSLHLGVIGAMLLILGLTILLRRSYTEAIPLPAPSVDYPGHDCIRAVSSGANESLGESRTAYDILWSCLATTFACAWLSVHPNVPFKAEGKWTILTGRL